MLAQVATTSEKLQRRLRYFFREWNHGARTEVVEFAERVSGLGDLAVIGGLVRDLALDGNGNFNSDVDFVADPHSLTKFDELLNSLGAESNRYGGYRLYLRKWAVDVWPLERTWVHTQGLRRVRRLRDLLQCTFFNLDAILYNYKSRKLIFSTNYFDDLSNRLLDLNFEPNPNRLGNAIRAVRYAYSKKLFLSPALARYVTDEFNGRQWEYLLQIEAESFSSPILKQTPKKLLMENLESCIRSANTGTRPDFSGQLEFENLH